MHLVGGIERNRVMQLMHELIGVLHVLHVLEGYWGKHMVGGEARSPLWAEELRVMSHEIYGSVVLSLRLLLLAFV